MIILLSPLKHEVHDNVW